MSIESIVFELARPFGEVITDDRISHHFAGQDDARGVYAKEIRIPAGTWLLSHAHAYDHISILASGAVRLTIDGVENVLRGPTALTIPKGAEHALVALTDVVWFCVHPTEETDAAKVDDAILSTGGG